MNGSQNNTLLLLFESPKTVFTMAGIALLTSDKVAVPACSEKSSFADCNVPLLID